jgi:hypothetical protein
MEGVGAVTPGVSRSIGTGAVGFGGKPSPTRTRPDLCAGMGHPGATYNTRMDMTWCLCGAEIADGDTTVPHIACCGGPLEEEMAP